MTQYAAMDDFLDYLGIEGAISALAQNSIDMALTNASAIIDAHTQRTYVASADSVRKYDAQNAIDGLRLWLDRDLAQLTSIVNGDGVAVALGAFVLEPAIGPPYYAITLKRTRGLSWTYTNDPEEAITVTGRWAHSIAPPDDIVQATLRLGAWLYHQRDNALDLDRTIIVGTTVLAPAAMPADVAAMLRPYQRMVI